MSTTRLMHLSGLSLILGGILLFIHFVTHPMGEGAQFVATSIWVPSHAVGFVAFLFLLLGVIGLYLRQADRLGMFGLIVFLLIFLSGMAFCGALLIGAAVQPIYPQAGNPGGPFLTSSVIKLVLSIGELWLPGFLLFAILSLRAKTFPPAGSWLIILSVVIGIAAALLPFGSTITYYLADLASAILAAGLCVWGYALWADHLFSLKAVETNIKEPLAP